MPLYGQEEIAGRKILKGFWNGKEIEYVEGLISVKVKKGITKNDISQALNYVKGKLKEDVDILRWTVIEIPKSADVFDAIKKMIKHSEIEQVIPVGIMRADVIPNDPYYNGTSPATYQYQWGLKNTGQSPPSGTIGADINAEQAWSITTGNQNVILVILDSGIPLDENTLMPDHGDLDDANKIIIGPDYTADGYSVRDMAKHGTHVAGIAAAETNNNTGIAGVAWNSKILAVQVFTPDDFGRPIGFTGWLRNGIRYAVDYQRNHPESRVVINFSGGYDFDEHSVKDAIIYANEYDVPIIASAGNTNADVRYPARYSTIL